MDIHNTIDLISQEVDVSNTAKPKIQLGDCELDLDLVEDFRHFVYHMNDLKYKHEYFIKEIEKAMRSHMYLNKDVRSSYSTKQLIDKIESHISPVAPPAPHNNTKIDHFFT